MTKSEAMSILSNIDYPGLSVELVWHAGSEIGAIRVSAGRIDRVTRKLARQNGRKWPLSPHMVESEVVQTVFMAIAAWEEHERRESFTYLKQRVFGLHMDLGRMAELLESGVLTEQRRVDERDFTGEA